MKKTILTDVIPGSLITVILLMVAVPGLVLAQETKISVNVSEWKYGESAQVAVDINNVNNLDAGQFDLLFDPAVAEVKDVQNGIINGKEIPVDKWRVIEPGRVRVLFNLPGVDGISGSGKLALIGFNVKVHGESALDISDVVLADTQAAKISGNWVGSLANTEGGIMKKE